METTNVKNTPSALKWLAEKRARLAGELEQVDLVLNRLTAQRAQLASDLDAMDRSIRIYDKRIDPHGIEPINSSFRSNYGKRGALKNAVLGLLEMHYPVWVSSSELGDQVAAHFKLEFADAKDKRRWQDGCLRSVLKRLAYDNIAERDPDERVPIGVQVSWRLKRSASGLEALELSATEAAAARANAAL